MSSPASLLARSAVLTTAALAIFATGRKEGRTPHSTADLRHVEGDVRVMLDSWIQSFESREEYAVRSVLADDERFVWLEDGEARYQSVNDVVVALASFPPGLQFSYELTSVRIVAMTDSAAWAQLGTTTQVRQGEHVLSEFTGAVLMLVQRDDGEWRIIAAHTSTIKPPVRSSG